MQYGQDVAQTKRFNYGVTFGTLPIGLTNDVDPTGVKIVMDPIVSGSTGKIILGYRLVSVEGSIKIQLQQVTRAMIDALTPMLPTLGPSHGGGLNLHEDLYQYAQKLTLHPLHLPSSDTSMDLNFAKVLPVIPLASKASKEDNVIDAEFHILVDRDSLTTVPYKPSWFWIGPVPS